mmetsp:Transcript_28778/g.51469  ORF Transcript_28778/g.51469 Transcript_28778/m.51469 type:complete len:253 (+) Transcript_28778:1053-1811(+)
MTRRGDETKGSVVGDVPLPQLKEGCGNCRVWRTKGRLPASLPLELDSDVIVRGEGYAHGERDVREGGDEVGRNWAAVEAVDGRLRALHLLELYQRLQPLGLLKCGDLHHKAKGGEERLKGVDGNVSCQWVVEGNQDDFAGVVAWVVHDVLAVGVLQKARFLANHGRLSAALEMLHDGDSRVEVIKLNKGLVAVWAHVNQHVGDGAERRAQSGELLPAGALRQVAHVQHLRRGMRLGRHFSALQLYAICISFE